MNDLPIQLSWFNEQVSWFIVLLLMGAMLLAAEIGYWAGGRRCKSSGETGRGHFSAVQAALLGLFALLLGFTFNMSNQRYETRRQLVIEDANTLAALNLRSDLLPLPERGLFKKLLREYVTVRVDASLLPHSASKDELAGLIAQSEARHHEMCALVQAGVLRDPPVKGAEALLPLLADTAALQRRRLFAYESRVPDSIIGLLLGAAIAVAVAVGYSGGLGKHRGLFARVMLTLFVSSTVFVILDLDQPRQGILKVDQRPILRIKALLDHEAETQP